jgi:hypothetical protein
MKIYFTVDSEPIIRHPSVDNRNPIKIGKLLAIYCNSYKKDNGIIIDRLSRDHETYADQIMCLRKILSYGYYETDKSQLYTEDISKILKIILFADIEFGINLNHDQVDLFASIKSTSQSYLDYVKILYCTTSYNFNNNLKSIPDLEDRTLKTIYEPIKASKTAKEYFEYPNFTNFLNLLHYHSYNNHIKYLLNLIKYVVLDQKNNITVDMTDRYKGMYNIFKHCNETSLFERYHLSYFEHVNKRITDKQEYFVMLLISGDKFIEYLNLTKQITRDLNILLKEEQMSLTTQEFLKAFRNLTDGIKNSTNYAKKNNLYECAKYIIKNHWDFFLSLITTLNKNTNLRPYGIESLLLNFPTSNIPNYFTATMCEEFKLLYATLPFNTAIINIPDNWRERLNDALGIISGKSIKPAVKN